MNEVVDIDSVLDGISQYWKPLTVATLNDYDLRLVKFSGEFSWHSHPETDECFLVLDGSLTIQLRDRDLTLSRNELFVVPRGVEHCPRADGECQVLLIEPSATVNTGDTPSSFTQQRRVMDAP